MPALVGANLRSCCDDLTSAGQAASRCSAQAKLLEHNVRFGDPECQCLMMRLESDLLAVLLDASEGRLAGTQLQWSSQPALTVVMAARGYPGAYAKGTRISNLNAVSGAKARGCERRAVESFGACRSVPDIAWWTQVFHAGTSIDCAGQLVASGGRVLGVTATADTVRQAQTRAYEVRQACQHVQCA